MVSSGLEPGQQKVLGMEEKLLWSVWALFLLHDKTQLSSIHSQSAYVINFGCQHSDASSFRNVTIGKKKLVCEINVWKNAGAYLCPVFVFVIFEVLESNLPSNKLVFLLHCLEKTIFLGVHGR